MFAVVFDGVVDELGELQSRLYRTIVCELQARYRVELQTVGELSAKVAGRVLQDLDRSFRLFCAREMREENSALLRSGETSTAVMVTIPTRGSLRCKRNSSASSR